jgi:hypothetical protein
MNTITINKSILDTATTESGGEPKSSQYIKLSENFNTIKQIELPAEPIRVHYMDGSIVPVNGGVLLLDKLMDDDTKLINSGNSGGFTHGIARKIRFPAFEETPFELKGGSQKTQKTTAQTPVYLQSAADFWAGLFDRSDADLKEIYSILSGFDDKMTKAEMLAAAEKIKKLLVSDDQIAAHAKMLSDEKGAHEIATICGLELSPTIELVDKVKHYSSLISLSQYDDKYDLIHAQVNVVSDNKEGRLIKLVFSLK